MERKQLKAKIVEMLNCDEIHELEKNHGGFDVIETLIKGLIKYKEVIRFILSELDDDT